MTNIILYNKYNIFQNLYSSIVFGIVTSIFLNETDTFKRNQYIICSSSTLFYLCEMERAGLLY